MENRKKLPNTQIEEQQKLLIKNVHVIFLTSKEENNKCILRKGFLHLTIISSIYI